MTTVKITTIGNSAGIILTKEVLAMLGAEKGDTLYVVPTPGGVKFTQSDEKFLRHMEVAEKIMREDYDVLKKLAE